MSGTNPVHSVGPHVVHFSSVREAVEQQSGLFEFLKQMLTIGLGGIAGLAAIFTDESKIPDDTTSRVTLGMFALSSIAVVVSAIFGISTYANYLRQIGWLAGSGDEQFESLVRRHDDAKKIEGRRSQIPATDKVGLTQIQQEISDFVAKHVKKIRDEAEKSKEWIVRFAQAVYWAAGIAAVALIVFAGFKLVDRHPAVVGPTEAMRAAESAIHDTVKHPTVTSLDKFERIEGNHMRLTYTTDDATTKYMVEIRGDGQIILIQPTK